MATAVLNKPQRREIDWTSPLKDGEVVTLEDYRAEIRAAENSGFISFEQFQSDMNQWFQN
jgi:hypothetical protein